jgi:hypothetical protein
MSLARWRASIRWTSERSGAAACFGADSLVADGIERRVYILEGAVQAQNREFILTST